MCLTNTRSNICFAMNTLSQYLGNSRCVHLIISKHVMRYLKGTTDLGHYYGRDNDYRLYIRMQIGMEVSQIEEAHQVDVIVWGLL